mmetsp:Transcript_30618/g.101862  ORF Transcript_30618/g.101862 Transcript_30618/m.101862 type:complete len:143 (+) Transcript_30618:294-722(+)
MMVVQLRSAEAARSSVRISLSVLESSDAVPSSTSKIWGRFKRTRAMATRCFSPPLSLRPRSPTMVCKPSGKAAATDSKAAPRMARCTSSSDAPGSPYRTFSYKLVLNKTMSCGTRPIPRRKEPSWMSRMSRPSTEMAPASQS